MKNKFLLALAFILLGAVVACSSIIDQKTAGSWGVHVRDNPDPDPDLKYRPQEDSAQDRVPSTTPNKVDAERPVSPSEPNKQVGSPPAPQRSGENLDHIDQEVKGFFRRLSRNRKTHSDDLRYVRHDERRPESLPSRPSAKRSAGLSFVRPTNKSSLSHLLVSSWTLKWVQTIPYHPRALSTLVPACAGTTLIAASPSGAVRSFSITSGRPLWRRSLPALSAGVAVVDDLAFVVSSFGDVYALSVHDGRVLWKTSLNETITALPVRDQKNRLLFRTVAGNVLALDGASGRFLWRSSHFQPDGLVVRDTAPLTILNDHLLVPINRGRFLTFDQDGHFLSSKSLFSSDGVSEVDRLSDLLGPIFSPRENLLCALSFRHAVGCYDMSSHSFSWVKDIVSNQPFVWDKRRIYLSGDDGVVESIYFDSGHQSWRSPFLGSSSLTQPVIFGKNILVGDRSGRLNILDKATGRLIHRLFFSRRASFFVKPLAVDSGVVLLSQDGHIYFVQHRAGPV